MMILFCDDKTCAHNDGQACKLTVVKLEVREGEFKDGKREVFNSCQNYRGKDDGES